MRIFPVEINFSKIKTFSNVNTKKIPFRGSTNSCDTFSKSSPKTNEDYLKKLASDLSKELNKPVSADKLSSIMTKEEILEELPKLSEQNYIATKENIENGIFQADLHSHSLHSDGKASVQTILNDAADYADKLNAKTGKKFIFALTDHDKIDGVKEALKIIAENPEKYKNVKFIPAAELSFIIPCEEGSDRYKKYKNNSQYPELLIYGINPFSENTDKFFNEVYSKRIKKIDDMTTFINKSFSEYPFSKESFDDFKKYSWMYTQNFGLINHMNEMYSQFVGKMLPKMEEDFIFPKFKNIAEVHSEYEKNFNDVVNYAEKENAVLGFAHPAYTVQNFREENQLKNMQYLVNNSKGTLKLSEKYHQAYIIGRDISSKADLDEYNKVLDKLNLINIGGRDNHKVKLL